MRIAVFLGIIVSFGSAARADVGDVECSASTGGTTTCHQITAADVRAEAEEEAREDREQAQREREIDDACAASEACRNERVTTYYVIAINRGPEDAGSLSIMCTFGIMPDRSLRTNGECDGVPVTLESVSGTDEEHAQIRIRSVRIGDRTFEHVTLFGAMRRAKGNEYASLRGRNVSRAFPVDYEASNEDVARSAWLAIQTPHARAAVISSICRESPAGCRRAVENLVRRRLASMRRYEASVAAARR